MKKYTLLLVLIMTATAMLAQPGPGPNFNPVPIDGGVAFLALIAAGIGVGKKLKDIRSRK